jgi:hypothetical protein
MGLYMIGVRPHFFTNTPDDINPYPQKNEIKNCGV